ncbi:hypothetical protein G6F37_011841 [Rhizopus arrhizus]|nr:hypothetical protein G6F38_011937 [Rhizopus arrhizus]KAG1147101.1 hypothetical protein G6F37_011841 [Rhizopus arrhizus]
MVMDYFAIQRRVANNKDDTLRETSKLFRLFSFRQFSKSEEDFELVFGLLIFINSKEEFLELQECLKVYNGASNFQVNYSKSVAFPLAGGSTFNNRLKELIGHNGHRWFDSQSLGCIKYLGYPIWFINELYSIKEPSASLNDRIARTTLEQPKNKGGVSLLNVEVQQKVFQFRYINPLLLSCRQRIPDFLYKMLIFTLQSSFDAPSHVIPLIFKHSRSYGNMKGQYSLVPMFSALDSCPRFPTENVLIISSQTSLLIPFKNICEEDPQEKFKFSKFLQAQKAYHFFERDFLSNGLQFKNRQHCGSPNLLQKIKNAVLTGNLTFKSYFASLLSAEQHDLEFNNEGNPIESSINFDPFIQHMSYDDINITALKNRQLKTIFSFNSNSQITNINHNN